jgi:hypothetical protein
MREIFAALVTAASIGAAAPAAAVAPSPDGERMFALVESLAAFGPRAPGTPGHAAARPFIERTAAAAGAAVTSQGFGVRERAGSWHRGFNIVARVRPDLSDRVLVGAHWDTRPRAERDPDPSRRGEPIVGANDGGSGTAILLHLAELFHAAPPPVGVDLVFFDAEDWGHEGDLANYCLGSRHYAGALDPSDRPRAAVVVDLVGDADLGIWRERRSNAFARDLVDRLWGIAAEVGAASFFDEPRHDVFDDHIPLLQAGIPAALIIDMDYAAWHTHADLPDKVSPASLEEVATVVATWIYRGAP